MSHSSINKFKALALGCTLGTLTSVAWADDVEIYIRPAATPVPPNVVFVLDESGSMSSPQFENGIVGGHYIGTSMDQLKQAMHTIINDSRNDHVNVGVLAYTTYGDATIPPFRVIHDFGEISDIRSSLNAAVDTLTPYDLTPTVAALAAATQWYKNELLGYQSPLNTDPKGNWCKPNVVVLLSDGIPSEISHNAGLDDLDLTFATIPGSHPSDWTYVDGIPTQPESEITQFPQFNTSDTNNPQWAQCQSDVNSGATYNPFDEYNYLAGHMGSNENGPIIHFIKPGYGTCTNEIIDWATSTDLKSGGEWDWDANDTTHDFNMKRKQHITFYTIGMGIAGNTGAEMYLKHIANEGGGKFYLASQADQLSQVFQSIIDDAKSSISYAYTAPTIPFNQNNAAITGDEIYIPLFKSNPHALWYGNLKKYKISFESEGSSGANATKYVIIRDANGAPALDNGLLRESSPDEWSQTTTSPGLPLNGGAASNMHPDGSQPRPLYTSLSEAPGTPIIDDANRIATANSNLPNSLLNLDELVVDASYDDSDKRAMILDWLTWVRDITLPDGNGGTVEVSFKDKMGAPIHSKPVVVRTNNAKVVFISTSEGILHALDGDTGKELWAYMPKDLLPTIVESFISDWNASKPHDDHGASLDGHPHRLIPNYGMDGPMVTYEYHGRRYLVLGMRRGGRNYYALDITDPMEPRLAWTIKGGTGQFMKLGQTWAKPLFATVQFNGQTTKTQVLIIAGGYDTKEDDYFEDTNNNGVLDASDEAIARSSDHLGNIIYFVNPGSGTLATATHFSGKIESVVKGEMNNSIVADLLPVDMNANGVIDRLYAADVGGRIIRVDIPDHAIKNLTGNGKISATVVADVNLTRSGNDYSEQDGSDYQRFFNAPEAAYFSKGGVQYLALLIGSGHQSRPLSNLVEHDRFYMIKDPNVWTAPPDDDGDQWPDYPDVIAENDLYDASANDIQDGSDSEKAQAAADLAASQGWYVNLANSEKTFSSAKVYDYAVLFTTYQAVPYLTDDPCDAVYTDGTSRFYALNMTNGSAMFAEMDGRETLDKRDRNKVINISGLPSVPYIITPSSNEDGEPQLSGDIVAMVGLQEVIRWPDRFHPISWEEMTGQDATDVPPSCN